MKHWLMKSEPDVYSIDDFAREKRTLWEGVRNYQARNFMMKDMKVGESFIYYHSNAEPNCAAGIGKIVSVGIPDPSALNKKSEYYDPKATPKNPIWYCVEVEFLKKFTRPLSLDDLRAEKALAGLPLLKRGNRLSVQPLSANEFQIIEKMGNS